MSERISLSDGSQSQEQNAEMQQSYGLRVELKRTDPEMIQRDQDIFRVSNSFQFLIICEVILQPITCGQQLSPGQNQNSEY